jgi:hypothetical protein
MIALEVNLDGLIYLIIGLWVVPPLVFWGVGGLLLHKKKKNAALVFGILGAIYLLVLSGVCLSIK